MSRPPEVGLPVNPRSSRREQLFGPYRERGRIHRESDLFEGKTQNPQGHPRGIPKVDPDVRRVPWPGGRPLTIWNPHAVEGRVAALSGDEKATTTARRLMGWHPPGCRAGPPRPS